MMVTFVSQCEKNALKKTRRVLDAFANRIGNNTWQTVITQNGLDAVKKMLRQSASKSTAVSCHWIRSRSRSQFLWVVGNKKRFNSDGYVAVNWTEKDLIGSGYESNWQTAEDITLLTGIAALFHDFGKANVLFQNKIDPNCVSKLSEPYRHEWVSLIMFIAFVGKLDDQAWLQKLISISPADDKQLKADIKNLISGNENDREVFVPFSQLMSPVARAVAWLILTHHKLPYLRDSAGQGEPIKKAVSHLDKRLVALWNSPQIKKGDWKTSDLKNVWEFKKGTPVASLRWCNHARDIADRALKRTSFFKLETNWLEDKFSLHVSRLSLMLSDHHYSSLPADSLLPDKSYEVYANSDRKTKKLKQKLDEHLIGVYQHSVKFNKQLPSLKDSLPAIAKVKELEKYTKNKRFKWQNKAYGLSKDIAEETVNTGFFGVNMASTGCGKTLANAKIMYALSNEKEGCRFTVALGLRTLTLQTGKALSSRLSLEEEDLAVLIGSQAVKKLHDLDAFEQAESEADLDTLKTGSESENDLIDQDQYVQYSGVLVDGALKNWLADKPKLHKLISAPILVSTIDHLMPATEGSRGGKQIAPMLRLLTSDLVLDEPDDFGEADLPALIRLVNWAGVLGARLLLSSATLPPASLEALYVSYAEGRRHYNRSHNIPATTAITCAWFDEDKVASASVSDQSGFVQQHAKFVARRAAKLLAQPPLHKAILSEAIHTSVNPNDIIEALESTICKGCSQLHDHHGQMSPDGKKVSIGLVRMVNINPLVAVAKQLAISPVLSDTHLHICIYHSQFPLIQRSKIENTLDSVLKRDDPNAIWQSSAIKEGLERSSATNHIFIILSTSVSEVGRDWCLDWAIAEPSSMRSLIQLAGRVQRHRRRLSDQPNLMILNTNYRALNKPGKPAFCRPGAETKSWQLKSHELDQVLIPDQYQVINAVARIQQRDTLDWSNNLVDLEHYSLRESLFNQGDRVGAFHWWDKPCHLTYQMQSATPFRASMPSHDYFLRLEAVRNSYQQDFLWWAENGEAKGVNSQFEPVQEVIGDGVSLWATQSCQPLLLALAEQMGQSLERTCMTFAAFNLRASNKPWKYSEAFGLYQPL